MELSARAHRGSSVPTVGIGGKIDAEPGLRRIADALRSSPPSAQPTDHALWAGVTGKARCADSALHPDQWFPVSPRPEIARREAAGAIAICSACPVRAQCLEFSLRHWNVGQHGVWGGLVAADRAALRRPGAAAQARSPASSSRT